MFSTIFDGFMETNVKSTSRARPASCTLSFFTISKTFYCECLILNAKKPRATEFKKGERTSTVSERVRLSRR